MKKAHEEWFPAEDAEFKKKRRARVIASRKKRGRRTAKKIQENVPSLSLYRIRGICREEGIPLKRGRPEVLED